MREAVSLNPAQRTAVEHRGDPLLVLAGAGTGKTRVITHRVAAVLAEGIPAWRVLAVTFTNKAAGEMRERIARLCEDRDDLHELWVGTFHATCARILRRHGDLVGLSRRFSIYDAADQASVMKRVLKDMDVSDRLHTPRSVLAHIDRAKNRGLAPDEIDQLGLVDPVLGVVRGAYVRYQERLQAADAADFGDLLLLAVKLLREANRDDGGQLGDLDPVARLKTRFQHVVVDEFQDTNPVQAELVDLLAGNAQLCVVGDDDQAIYRWRGADVEQILGFDRRHPGTRIIRLEQNYRSTRRILRCADAVIRRNEGRLGKTLYSDLGEGDPPRVIVLEDERQEARMLAEEISEALDLGASGDDFAVFYRTHAQSRVIEDELRTAGLRCRIVGGVAFYERLEVRDVLSYLTLLHNPNSDAHLLRIINRPTRGIGTTTVQRLVAHAREHGISLWRALDDPESASLAKLAARRVREFRQLVGQMRETLEGMPLSELAAQVVETTGYRESLAADDTEESHGRLENLQELLGNMEEFEGENPEATLEDYLERVSLLGEQEQETDGDVDGAVTLMTLHSAKGLEFENVYLTGLEEQVFPHARVMDDPIQMEEERRLAYVAMTRAKRGLTMTMAHRRRLWGQQNVGTPSRFLRDLPREDIAHVGSHTHRTYLSHAAPRPPRERDSRAEITPEPSDLEGEGVPLYVGMPIRHSRFGEGELLGWSGTGRDCKLQLKFPEHGMLTILARFCEPA
jgi:DNA helicase-2/ATP-dependent DNA helicase PcrA